MAWLVSVAIIAGMLVFTVVGLRLRERSDRRQYEFDRVSMGPIARSVCDPLFGHKDG